MTAATAVTSAVRSRALAPGMVGRRESLRQLDEHFAAVRAGAGRVVFLAGEAGVGKSRLLRAFLERARQHGAGAVFEGHCYDEDPAVPYGPFLDAIRGYLRRDDRAAAAITRGIGPLAGDLARLLPELEALAPVSPAGGALGGPIGEKRRFFEAICGVVRPAGGDRWSIVALEDLHWADRTSQDLVRYLARAILHDRVLLLATYRTDELHRRHPLTGLIAQLTGERLYHEVRLAPLARDDLAQLLAETLGQAPPNGFVDALFERTGGNPFFAEEILRSLLEHGRLDEAIEAARAGRELERLAIPISVRETILGRTAGLDETTVEVLRYAATIGPRFDFELLLRLTGLEEGALLRAVERLVERQLVVEEGGDGPVGCAGECDDRYRFRHALTREAVYGDLLGRERRIRHREVLRALEERHAGDPEPAIDQLAYHSLRARELALAAHYARLAGDRAARLCAHREAVAHLETALDLLESDDPREAAGLYEQLARAAYPLGDTALYARYWREAQRLYQRLGDRRKVATIHIRLGRTCWERADGRAAFEHAAAALAAVRDEPACAELAMAHNFQAQLQMLSSRPQAGVEWGERGLRLAEALDDPELRSHALNTIGCALGDLGDVARGLEHLERSLEIARRHWTQFAAGRAYHNLAWTVAYLGQFQRAAAIFREGTEFCARHGVELHVGIGRASLGWIELKLGNHDAAGELFDWAIHAGEIGLPMARLLGLPWKGELLRRQGRLEEARRILEAVLPESERQGRFQTLREVSVPLARALLPLGDRAAAGRVMDRCVAAWRQTGSLLHSQELFPCGVEVYLSLGCEDRVPELLSALATLAERVGSPLALANHEGALGLVAAHEGRHETAAAHFGRAAERWEAMEVPYAAGQAHLQRAESLLRAGPTPGAREEARRDLAAARERLEPLGATPEVEAADAFARRHGLGTRPAPSAARAPGRAALTPRERQVLALLTQGLSNREIAKTLVMSERTAEVHISNIFGKLGATCRAQAAAHAIEHGLVDAPGLASAHHAWSRPG